MEIKACPRCPRYFSCCIWAVFWAGASRSSVGRAKPTYVTVKPSRPRLVNDAWNNHAVAGREALEAKRSPRADTPWNRMQLGICSDMWWWMLTSGFHPGGLFQRSGGALVNPAYHAIYACGSSVQTVNHSKFNSQVFSRQTLLSSEVDAAASQLSVWLKKLEKAPWSDSQVLLYIQWVCGSYSFALNVQTAGAAPNSFTTSALFQHSFPRSNATTLSNSLVRRVGLNIRSLHSTLQHLSINCVCEMSLFLSRLWVGSPLYSSRYHSASM